MLYRRHSPVSARQRQSVFLLTGLLWCGVHNLPYVGTSNGHHEYYICSVRNRHNKEAANCPMLRRESLEQMLLVQLQERVFSPTAIRSFWQEVNETRQQDRGKYAGQLEGLGKQLSQARRELHRLQQAIVDGIPASQVKEPLDRATMRLDSLEQEQARLTAIADASPLAISDELVAEMCAIAWQAVNDGEPEKVKAFLAQHVKRAVIEGKTLTIHYSTERLVVTAWLPESGEGLSLQKCFMVDLAPYLVAGRRRIVA